MIDENDPLAALTTERSGPCSVCAEPTSETINFPAFTDASGLSYRLWRMRRPLVCAVCAGARDAEIEVRLHAEREREAERDKARTYRRRLGRSDLPRAFRDDFCDLDRLDTEGRADALRDAHRFAAGELPGLVLTGPVGVGKTTIVAAAAKRYMLQTGSLRWLAAHEVTARLSLPFEDERRISTIDALATPGALVLDDLDKTRPSAYAAEPLFSAIDRAIAERRGLLITTNLRLGELSRHWPEPYGDALVSRLGGYCAAWRLVGDDRRRAGPARRAARDAKGNDRQVTA